LLAAIAAAAIAASAVSAATTPSEFSTTVVFAVTYNPDCTFTVNIEGGPSTDSSSPATSSATIPPGPYQVTVRTPLPDNNFNGSSCEGAQFSLTGPGVSYSSVLGTAGPYSATFNETFLPSSTYTLVDAARPGNPVTFTTTATGSSSSLLPPPPPSTASGSSVQAPLVGSEIVPFRGSLDATVAPSDKVTVMSGKKPLASVKPGRYDIVVDDESTSGGFFVQKLDKKARSITGVRFKGRHTVQVTLTAGEWTFFAQPTHQTKFAVAA